MDRNLQDELIREHLPIVGYEVSDIARRLPSHVRREDLASAGALALVQAGRSFDPSRGVPFSRYAARRIRGAIVDELRSMDWAPRAARRQARRLSDVREQLTDTLHRAPTREELAEALGVETCALDVAQGHLERRLLSLDVPGGTAVMELSDSQLGPEARILVLERLRYLHAAVAELPDRHRAVIEGLFFRDRTANELATELGVTPSRISQMRSEALRMLGDALRTAYGHSPVTQTDASASSAECRLRAYIVAVAARATRQRSGADDRAAVSYG